MDAQLRELLPFLRDRNPQVRGIALANLLPQTIKDAPHRIIFFAGLSGGGLQKPKESDVIRDLKLLCRDQLTVAHDAFRALVNLSDSPLLLASLSQPLFLNFIVSYIINPQSILADLASMLLSNLTASSAACSTLLSMKVSIIPFPSTPENPYYLPQSRCETSPSPSPAPSGHAREVLALPLLVDAFVQGAQIDGGDLSKRIRKGHLHFLASVFANLSVSPGGRNFFLTPYPTNPIVPDADLEYPLAKLVNFTEHGDTIRRAGVAATIKNCAFHAPSHRALLNPESTPSAVPPSKIQAPGIDVLPYILLPLAGPEEFDLEDQDKLPPALQLLPPDKKRDSDPALRLTHVETLLLLCHTRWGREHLRANGVYEIVQAAHLCETVDKISEHIERLVMLLKGEEPAYIEGEDEEIAVMGEVGAKAPEAESDDEDDKIVEV